jgi:ribosomal subunit interface protein
LIEKDAALIRSGRSAPGAATQAGGTMAFRVSGKNIDVGEALRARISERIDDLLTRYFDRGYSGHATVGKEGFGFRTECAVHLDSGVVLQAEGLAADAYSSADQAALRIEKRLRRYRGRLKSHPRADEPRQPPAVDATSYVIAAPDHDDEVADFSAAVIAETTTALQTLSVSEAVMELDMTGAPVVIFCHAASGRLNIVYRRPDGNIGWIDPPASNAK